MSRYIPPPNPHEVAERQRRVMIGLLWLLATPPLVFALMVFGYSDQAPAALRSLTIWLDGLVGSPVWAFLQPGAR
jgi:ABC-type polysaccharide/polyol phosphate export permease